jgi:hypothetical protein
LKPSTPESGRQFEFTAFYGKRDLCYSGGDFSYCILLILSRVLGKVVLKDQATYRR